MATHRTYAPLDWNGGEASATIHSWPVRNEGHSSLVSKQREWSNPYETASQAYGVKIRCNSSQPFLTNVNHPVKPAGTSQRVCTFYQKTGTMAHRTEPQYRDTKGTATLVEQPARAGRNLATWKSLTYPLSATRSPSTVREDESARLEPFEIKGKYNFDQLPMYRTTHAISFTPQDKVPGFPPWQDPARDYTYFSRPPAAGRLSAW